MGYAWENVIINYFIHVNKQSPVDVLRSGVEGMSHDGPTHSLV